MDDFAQSREPDDLFADEIEPTEPEIVGSTATAPQTPPSHASASVSKNQPRHANQKQRGGRRGGNNNGASSSRTEQQSQTKSTSPAQTDSTPPAIPSIKPENTDEPARVTSVRGDRSATGPAKPTKKTEEELNELMASMQLKSAAKAEAYARAEKDQASFLQREQQAAAKRMEERKAIREQDAERAKNRERKIKAQGGREWDSQKLESDVVDRSRGSSSMYSRGAHGGIRGGGRGGLASSRYGGEDEDTEEAPYGGRGSRGRGRGRSEYQGGRGGRGRGGYFNSPNANVNTAKPSAPGTDFPALPTPTNKSSATRSPKREVKEKPAVLPGAGQGDWADEMATPIEKTP
jgi:hypothetical protein